MRRNTGLSGAAISKHLNHAPVLSSMCECQTAEKDSHSLSIDIGFSVVCRLPWTDLMSMLQSV